MSRRYAEATQAFLWLWRRRLRPVPPGAGLSLVLDRTGLSLVGAGAVIPIGFPSLVVRSVQHTVGRSASQTVITARPASAVAGNITAE